MVRSLGGIIQAAFFDALSWLDEVAGALMTLTRRHFAGLAAGLPFWTTATAAVVREPEVVVIGAGVAGIAAAQTLINGGRSVQIIEAAPRIGGRCYTDTATFGVPFDRGAAWLK